MEIPFSLRTPDRKVIYGTLKKSPKKASTLLILVHGLAGAGNNILFYKATNYFPNCSVDTAQVDLYHWGRGRRLKECDLTTNINDLALVVSHFRKKYKQIFLAGHSLGGLIVIGSPLALVDGLLLWDPSRRENSRISSFKWVRSMKLYKIDWDMDYFFSKKLVDEWKNFPKPAKAAKNLSIPTLVVNAGKGILIKAGKEYFKNAPAKQKVYKCIKGAGHSFEQEGKAEELFKISLDFIKSVK